MIWNDLTNRQGAVQEMEDICGLGATGITGNTVLFQQFTRWSNKWNKIGAKIAILAQDGWDIDDQNWTNYPSGTYTGTTNRDYVFAATELLLKLKKVGMTYNGTNYVEALPIDTLSEDYNNVKSDPNIDAQFSSSAPRYDPKANAIDIYPKFTAAQVSAGAKVYVEFYREPKEYATTGTDTYILPFLDLVTKGASYEYCAIYKPDLAGSIRLDLYGNGGNIPGIIKDMQNWYDQRYPHKRRLIPNTESTK